MKKALVPVAVAITLLGSVAATAWAAGGSPFGKVGDYDKVELMIDRSPISDRGVIIDGKLYVPMDTLRDRNKAAYYYDVNTYQAYLFFGGAGTTNQANTTMTTGNNASSTRSPNFMSGIPYDANNYHAGMMRQDIINISTLAKALMNVSKDMDSVVYAKLTFNRDPDMNLLHQQLNYRSMTFDIMDERMYALADELGRQLGSSNKRNMKDIIDDIHDAVRNKEKALSALQDWLVSSDKRDLEDFKDYEKDAKDLLVGVVKKLTGENLDPGSKKSSKFDNNLLDAVDKWSGRLRK
ncbi:hypothetical protein ACQCN2_09980 [Brevibacillus ginsengisoli]|uniref:hypothetical protein n=1 Tax=Brevibacillus ginsengisoli TaxID=363854 RepID=UPI003CF0A4ED